MTKFFAALLLASTLAVPVADDAARYMALVEGAQQPARQGFDGLTLAELMDRLHVPGASVAVIRDFEIHWARGYGVADVESGARVDTDTLFQAASISKPVAAMATMKAVEAGHFTLDDDINTLLRSWKLAPGPYTARQAVTPRALLSHTSGLGDGFGFPGYTPGEKLPTIDQILDGQAPSNVGRVFMERPPFTAFKYSGGGTILMQLALGDRLGEAFESLVHRWVLEPLELRHSTYEQPLSAARDGHAARAHDERGRAMEAKWHVYPELAAAGLWTTPSDLARLAIEVQNGLHGSPTRVLSAASLREMTSPVGVGEYGVGFHLSKRGEGWYFGHGGSNWGFRAQLVAHKLKGYGVAVMTNGENGGPLAEEVVSRVAAAYGWDLLDKPVPRLAWVTDSRPADRAGRAGQ